MINQKENAGICPRSVARAKPLMITGAKLSIIRCVLGKRIAYRAGLTPLMKSNIKPYAQSLRAIGQALECLRINTVALQKKDERYIVRNWEPSFLKNITLKVWGTVGSDQLSFTAQESKDTLLYSSSDTKRLKAYGRSRRGSKDNQNTYNISLGLRLVGDYLDRKGAVGFSIWWSIESVKVRYEAAAGSEEEVSFTVQIAGFRRGNVPAQIGSTTYDLKSALPIRVTHSSATDLAGAKYGLNLRA